MNRPIATLTADVLSRGRRCAAPMPAPVATAAVALTVVAFVAGAMGCAATRQTVRAKHPPAPLDPEIASLPGAAGSWMPDPVFGGRLYVIEAGPRGGGLPPLFLVHGLGEAGVRDFYPVFARLARKRHVVAFDLPGFGRSSRANLRYEPTAYATVVSLVVAAYTEGKVDVLGHSLGGAVALAHAGGFPDQVRRLVVVDAAGILHREAFVEAQVHHATGPASALLPGLTEMVRGMAGAALTEARKFEPPPELILNSELLRQTILRADPGRIAALGLILHNFGPALTACAAPTLIVWGANDSVASLRTGHLLADRLRHARLAVLEGVGHVPMLDAPDRLLALVESHLDVGDPLAAMASPTAGEFRESRGDVTCNGEADVRFSGVYQRIMLDHCARAVLDGVHARRVTALSSSLELSRTTVEDGVVAAQSNVVMTGGRVRGEVAFDLDGSRVDLAGVAIDATREAIQIRSGSRILFSVCPVQTASALIHAHGAQAFAPGQTLQLPLGAD